MNKDVAELCALWAKLNICADEHESLYHHYDTKARILWDSFDMDSKQAAFRIYQAAVQEHYKEPDKE